MLSSGEKKLQIQIQMQYKYLIINTVQIPLK